MNTGTIKGERAVAAEWFDEELRENIKKRRYFNKKYRKAKRKKYREEVINYWKLNYEKQKKITKRMTAEKKGGWEKRKIRESKESNGASMWKVIKEILGKTKKKDETVYLYDEHKNKKEAKEVWQDFLEYWRKNIYQKDNIDIEKLWRGDSKEKGLKVRYQNFIRKRKNQRKTDIMMEIPKITEKELIKRINELKNGKAAGTDGVRAEAYKQIINNKKIRKAMVRSINQLWYERELPRRWRESNTTMIKKTERPTFKEFRPIAVTCISAKLVWGFIRDKIEEHLYYWGQTWDNQFGFTKGGRVEHSLLILQYVANKAFDNRTRYNKKLYFAMIDFRKAYDSVNR